MNPSLTCIRNKMVDLLTLASKVPSLVSMVQLTEVDTIVTTANVDVEAGPCAGLGTDLTEL